MIQENYVYLTERFAALGFSNVYNSALQTAMKLDLPKFDLSARELKKNGDEFIFKATIEKGKNAPSGKDSYYYINRFDVSLQKPGNELIREQSFGLYMQKGFNAVQMRSLMNSRYVHGNYKKDDEVIPRWQYVDFSVKKEDGNHPLKSIYDRNIDFDVVQLISALPHIAATQQAKENMVRSLYNGEYAAATIRVNGQTENVFLLANPKATEIEIYNSQGNRINLTNNSMELITDLSTFQQRSPDQIPAMTQQLMAAVTEGKVQEHQETAGKSQKSK
jgi:hypothetical protein